MSHLQCYATSRPRTRGGGDDRASVAFQPFAAQAKVQSSRAVLGSAGSQVMAINSWRDVGLTECAEAVASLTSSSDVLICPSEKCAIQGRSMAAFAFWISA